MQKSTFKLTKHELDFISDPRWMSLKQKVIRDISSAMQGLGEWVMQAYFPAAAGSFKITRGENYLDMPYVVLDAPQLKANELAGKLRIMFWWGHYISLQYFVAASEQMRNKLEALKQKDYTMLQQGDLFNNDLEHPDFKPIAFFAVEHLEMPVTKICTKIYFTDMHALEQHIRLFMDDMKTWNELTP